MIEIIAISEEACLHIDKINMTAKLFFINSEMVEDLIVAYNIFDGNVLEFFTVERSALTIEELDIELELDLLYSANNVVSRCLIS